MENAEGRLNRKEEGKPPYCRDMRLLLTPAGINEGMDNLAG